VSQLMTAGGREFQVAGTSCWSQKEHLNTGEAMCM